MNYQRILLALAIMAQALPAAAFESRNPESRERMRIELVPLRPTPAEVQENFDRYVQDLAAAARRDAESPPQKPDRIKELQAKAVNPLVRW